MKRGTISPKRKAALQKKLERLGMRFARMQGVIPPRRRQKESVVDVILADGREMDRIKKKSGLADGKKHPYGTDVLSFPEPSGFPHPDHKGIFLGDIYLNEEIFMGDPERGLALFIHGFLHLLGYDHIKKRDTIVMEGLEKRLLRKLKSF